MSIISLQNDQIFSNTPLKTLQALQAESGVQAMYDEANRIFGSNKDASFMNHGYYPVDQRCSDVFLDTCGSLYCYLADKFGKVTNKNILDIGCGRGGGTKLLRKHYNFSEVFGCDLNEKNIAYCRSNHQECYFEVDNAETLEKQKDNFFDFAINVESSHCYRDLNSFFNSAKRVLKKDGQFITADLIQPDRLSSYIDIIGKYFEILEIKNITQNVADSCEHLMRKVANLGYKDEIHSLYYRIAETQLRIYSSRERYFLSILLQKRYN